MLNKDVCLHCYLSSVTINDERKDDKAVLKEADTKRFEHRWRMGWTLCSGIITSLDVNRAWETAEIHKNPPTWCRYTLEHVVSAGDY
jgi:hypothetical protein